jgi:cobalt-zinc-cadmium resistance protein CzcA
MIRSLVDFALNNRILVLSLAVLLFIWGLVSFHNLPIEAYPDVADTYVQIISQCLATRPRRWSSRLLFF